MQDVEIIDYDDLYASDFKRINLEWLEKYSLKEELDVITLDNPRKKILDTGGVIYLAKVANEIVGSAALINEGNGIYELAKMAVTPAWQGRGISSLLLEKCLAKAQVLDVKTLILFSHTSLTNAIGLYKKYGFKHVDVVDSPFATANVKMVLEMGS
jgi:N-acetylglutamate synthase-like GNAT family acetyltransferase